jgi:hypothetical protein
VTIVSDTEWDDMRDALASCERENAKLVEGICLLGDTLLSSFHAHGMFESTPETRAAAKPLKDVIQNAWSLIAGYDHVAGEWSHGTAWCADALRDALAHPVIADLLDAWATKEG